MKMIFISVQVYLLPSAAFKLMCRIFSGSKLIRKCIFEFYPIPLYDMLKLHFFQIFRTYLLLWWECRLFEFGAAAVPLVIFHVAGRRTSDAPKSQFQFSTSSTVVKWYQSWRQRQVVLAWPVLHKFTVHINIKVVGFFWILAPILWKLRITDDHVISA